MYLRILNSLLRHASKVPFFRFLHSSIVPLPPNERIQRQTKYFFDVELSLILFHTT